MESRRSLRATTGTRECETDARHLRFRSCGRRSSRAIDEWFKKSWITPISSSTHSKAALAESTRRRRVLWRGSDARWRKARESRSTVTARIGGGGRFYTVPVRRARIFRCPSSSNPSAWHMTRPTSTCVSMWSHGRARARYQIGIDTYRRNLGDPRLPHTATRAPVGLEFVLDIGGPEQTQLLVDHPYNPYRPVVIPGSKPQATQYVYNPAVRVVANDLGQWDSLVVAPNRRRIGRDGRIYPAISYNRNRLLHARESDNSLADWFADPRTGVIEVRLPWGMLQLVDPSTRSVSFAIPAMGMSAEHRRTGSGSSSRATILPRRGQRATRFPAVRALPGSERFRRGPGLRGRIRNGIRKSSGSSGR